MAVEYLVLQAYAEQGPFARVSAHKLNQSWDTLQAALDELGQHAWDLCTCPSRKLESVVMLDICSGHDHP
jgi:hypothetical protein